MNKNFLMVPSDVDWGDLSDRDIAYSYEYFGGRSNSDMQAEYKKNINERCINLKWMPETVFKYYIYGLKDFIETADFGLFAKTSSVQWLFDIFSEKAKLQEDVIKGVFPDFQDLMELIIDNYQDYELDIESRDDMQKKLKIIKLNLV